MLKREKAKMLSAKSASNANRSYAGLDKEESFMLKLALSNVYDKTRLPSSNRPYRQRIRRV